MQTSEIESKFCRLRDLIIEKEFSHLDKFQIEAVLNNHRNALVLACPGSGKTTVLINKIIYLIKYGNIYNSEKAPETLQYSDIEILENYLIDKKLIKLQEEKMRIKFLLGGNKVNPSNIIVITFTKAAAINMKKRFEALSLGGPSPFFGTFHGLFYKILLRHQKKLNIIDSSEAYRVMSNILLKHIDEVSEEKIKELRNKISLFKGSDLSIEEFEPNIDKKIFIDCYNHYESYKKEREVIDFDDLQIKLKALLQENRSIAEHYRKGFKYMMIDEFQDIDNIQLQVLKTLNTYNSVFAVGDEDQCIYSFRGSRPDYMIEFEKHFIGGIKLHLSINYRTSENIVKVASNLIRINVMRNDKKMIAFKKEKKRLEILRYHDDNLQAEDIALNIEKLKSIGGYHYDQCAVLYRTNIESRSLIDTFIRKKIPFRLLDKEYNFFDHFICKDILAYLKLSIFPDDRDSFKRIINKPFRFISKISLDKLSTSTIKGNCFDALKAMESTPVFQIKNLEKLQKEISSLNKMSLQSAIEYITSDLGYHDYILEYSKKFKIQVSEFEDIIQELKGASAAYKNIIGLLAHIEQVKEELIKNNLDKNEDSVILSTIHGVKGMEFNNVFIVNCVEEVIPHVNNIEEGIEEERRLFFVALTRTIDNCFICVPRNLRGKLKQPSRFISECNINIYEDLHEIYQKGEQVKHISFGVGMVINIDNNAIEIRFENNIDRLFDIAVVHNNGIIKKLN